MPMSEIWDYPGEYVAVTTDGRVVAHDPTGPGVVAKLRALPKEVRNTAALRWVPRPDDPEYAGSGGAW
jgi:hypothetical protein